MKSNFEFLKDIKEFYPVYKASVVAELNYQIDASACCLLCRRATEFAFVWLSSKHPDFKREVFNSFDENSEEINLHSYIMRSGFSESLKNHLHYMIRYNKLRKFRK